MNRIIHSLSDLVTGTAATGHVPLFHATGGWKTVADAVVDVRAHGATGDGSTDDTAAFVAAISAVAANGTILVPAGRYRISSLVLTKTVRFLGVGSIRHTTQEVYGHTDYDNPANYSGGSVLECTATSGAFIDTSSVSAITVHLERIALVGVGDATRTTIGVKTGTVANSSYQPRWNDVVIVNFAVGMQAKFMFHGMFSGIEFRGCEQAIDWAENCNQNTMTQLLVTTCGAAATNIVQLDNCEVNTFIGVTFQTNWAGTVFKLQNTSEENTIANLYSENSSGIDYAIDIASGCDANMILNFHLSGYQVPNNDKLRCASSGNVFKPGKYLPTVAGSMDISAGVQNIWLSLASQGTALVQAASSLTAANASALNTGDATSDTVIGNMRTRIGEIEAQLLKIGFV